MAANMEKFATQLERDVLIALKEYASRDGQTNSIGGEYGPKGIFRVPRETQGSKTRY